jgi:hypothetical protein
MLSGAERDACRALKGLYIKRLRQYVSKMEMEPLKKEVEIIRDELSAEEMRDICCGIVDNLESGETNAIKYSRMLRFLYTQGLLKSDSFNGKTWERLIEVDRRCEMVRYMMFVTSR